MVAFLDAHPQAAALGPKLVNPDGTFQASFARFPTLLSELLLATGLARFTLGPYAPSPRPRPGETARPVDWVAGAALMVRRSALAAAGPLDESFFLYSEETDWCRRLWQAGQPVWYLPGVEIVHEAGASSRQQSARRYGLLYQSKVRFFERHYGRLAAGALRAGLLLVAAARMTLWWALRLARATSDPQRLALRAEQERALMHAVLAPRPS
jgi:GT2 family glycosyltransferase